MDKWMEFKSLGLLLIGSMLFSHTASAAVKTETIEYKQGSQALEGYLAYDDAVSGKRPGVLIAHEWMGLSDYEKKRAEQIAGLGYVAFALDIYGKGIRPDNPKDAGAEAGIYKKDRGLLRERALAGLKILEDNPRVDTSRLAAIGYCFGGTTVLELARAGAPLKGVVTFHGGLDTPTPQDAKNIKGKVLVLHGADDPFSPMEQVRGLEKEMTDAGVDWEVVLYSHTVHSFTNPKSGNDPSKGIAYNPESDKRSFKAMEDFFKEIFS